MVTKESIIKKFVDDDRTFASIAAAMSEWADEQEKSRWVAVEDGLPEKIEGKEYSENVLAIVKGMKGIQVMCRTWTNGENEEGEWIYGPVWSNCYGRIDCDEPEWDDDYEVTHWQPLPPNPSTDKANI